MEEAFEMVLSLDKDLCTLPVSGFLLDNGTDIQAFAAHLSSVAQKAVRQNNLDEARELGSLGIKGRASPDWIAFRWPAAAGVPAGQGAGHHPAGRRLLCAQEARQWLCGREYKSIHALPYRPLLKAPRPPDPQLSGLVSRGQSLAGFDPLLSELFEQSVKKNDTKEARALRTCRLANPCFML